MRIAALTILPDVTHEGVLAGLQILHDVLVEGVHVLHQPLGGAVVDLAGVVEDREVGIALEVALDELGVSGMGVGELLHEGLVGGLGEPALLVTQGHDTHGLRKKSINKWQIELQIFKLHELHILTSNKVLKQVLNKI